MQQPTLTVYGHPGCPMVVPVRHFLDRAAVPYKYINIHEDAEARALVRQMNTGNETVPTLVFSDGTILSEPSVEEVQAKLRKSGLSLPPFMVFFIQHSLQIILVGFLLVGLAGGLVWGSAVLGGVVGLSLGFLVTAIRIRRAGS
jgi:mycoredoxin